MEITRLTEATEQDASDLARLASELHGEARSMSVIELTNLILDEDIDLMVVREEGRIVGSQRIILKHKHGLLGGLENAPDVGFAKRTI